MSWVTLADACGSITSQQYETIGNEYFKRITKGKEADNKEPVLVILFGIPGAGKSTIASTFTDIHYPKTDFVNFDFDDIMTGTIIDDEIKDTTDTNGNKTGIGLAYGWNKCITDAIDAYGRRVLDKLRQNKYNIVLNTHNMEIMCDFVLDGYKSTFIYVIVSVETALRRTSKRAIEQGRFNYPANEENAWGWKTIVINKYTQYMEKAPWYARWCDSFYIVNNDRDLDDFTQLEFEEIDTDLTLRELLATAYNYADDIYGKFSKQTHKKSKTKAKTSSQ
jgi:chloramphenicol 3-O-phosphotransferase